jgi:hypothetical protein
MEEVDNISSKAGNMKSEFENGVGELQRIM